MKVEVVGTERVECTTQQLADKAGIPYAEAVQIIGLLRRAGLIKDVGLAPKADPNSRGRGATILSVPTAFSVTF